MKSIKCPACLKFTPAGRGACIACGNKFETPIIPANVAEVKNLLGYPIAHWVISFVILLIAIGFFVFNVLPSQKRHAAQVDACIQRGIIYFKEMGAYPILRSPIYKGRQAEEVVIERCNKTTTAF